MYIHNLLVFIQLSNINIFTFIQVSKKAIAKQDNQVDRAVRLVKEAAKIDYEQDMIGKN